MEKLVDIKRGIRTGVKPDEQFSEETLWADGRNVVFSDGAVRPVLPQFPFMNPSTRVPITGAVEATMAGVPNLFWGTTQKIFRLVEGSDVEDCSPTGADYTLTRDNLWQMIHWKDKIIAVADDMPQLYPDGSNNFADMSPYGVATAKLVAKFKIHVLFGNTDVDDKGIFWSDADDETEFEPEATNLAGGLRIRDLNSEIIAWAPLAKVFLVYGSTQVFVVQYIGGTKVFSSDSLLSGIGAYSKHSVVAVGNKHYGMGSEGIWVTDGFEYKYLDRGAIHRHIFDDFNADKSHLVVAWHNVAETMVCFFWCSGDSNELDQGAGYNYVDDNWSLLGYARTFGTSKEAFGKSILADHLGNLWWQQEKGGTATPPPSEPVPVSTDGEGLIVAEAGFGSLGFGYGGFGYVWGVGEDGTFLGFE